MLPINRLTSIAQAPHASLSLLPHSTSTIATSTIQTHAAALMTASVRQRGAETHLLSVASRTIVATASIGTSLAILVSQAQIALLAAAVVTTTRVELAVARSPDTELAQRSTCAKVVSPNPVPSRVVFETHLAALLWSLERSIGVNLNGIGSGSGSSGSRSSSNMASGIGNA